ncbi:DEKNAAC104098 [Brettanomyces naardenensis]|uniref:DEKNAAC104098 n=1 Tax=Brettanomyces naardenensis TaxID=13370 RepID=A0A448YQ07_BRENA|nr:DEKNAAC104098 [Brettanomyces naardenensis]
MSYLLYLSLSNQLHELDLQALEEFRLAEQAEYFTNLLKVIENAEKKYNDTYNDLQARKKQDSRQSLHATESFSSSKKYNQLMIKYNMSQTDNRNLERSYTELKRKYQDILQKNKTSRFQQVSSFSTTPYLPKLRNVTFKSPGVSPSKGPRSPSRSPLRTSIFNSSRMAQSTPTVSATPSPSARKILSDLSNNRRLSIQDSPSNRKQRIFEEDDDNEENEFSFSKINRSKLEMIKGEGKGVSQENTSLRAASHGTQRIQLRRTLVSQDNDVSPTGKRSRDEDDVGGGAGTKKLSQVRTIRGGQPIGISSSISPLKSRNNKLRATIFKR